MLKIPIDILIVDDEEDFVEMLSLRLADEGHKVRAELHTGPATFPCEGFLQPDTVRDVTRAVSTRRTKCTVMGDRK